MPCTTSIVVRWQGGESGQSVTKRLLLSSSAPLSSGKARSRPSRRTNVQQHARFTQRYRPAHALGMLDDQCVILIEQRSVGRKLAREKPLPGAVRIVGGRDAETREDSPGVGVDHEIRPARRV